ncbi:hypothetical protein CR513_47545, partial [Mucuna pruriens]
MTLIISFCINFHQHMDLSLSSHESLDINLMNYGQLGRIYDFKEFKEQIIKTIFEQKGSCILKNVTNKIMNGQDNVTRIPTNVQAILDQHRDSIDFKNKSFIVKANRVIDKGASAYCIGSISITKELQWLPTTWEVVERTKKLKTEESNINNVDNNFNNVLWRKTHMQTTPFLPLSTMMTYYNIIGGKNDKGNIYGLSGLSNKLFHSIRLMFTLIEMSMVKQLEGMCKAIHKLNNELIAK